MGYKIHNEQNKQSKTQDNMKTTTILVFITIITITYILISI